MKPTDFPEANKTLTPPKGMENCENLRAAYDGSTWVSCWQPTWKERLAILFGNPVWLFVASFGHPPVALTTDHPWPNVRPLGYEGEACGPVIEDELDNGRN